MRSAEAAGRLAGGVDRWYGLHLGYMRGKDNQSPVHQTPLLSEH